MIRHAIGFSHGSPAVRSDVDHALSVEMRRASVEGNRLANSAGSSAGDGGSRHIEKCLKLKILYGVINLIGVFLVESKFKS